MSEMRPIRPGGSLLERAAQAYDLGSVFGAPVHNAADLMAPPPKAAPPPAPAPAAMPVPAPTPIAAQPQPEPQPIRVAVVQPKTSLSVGQPGTPGHVDRALLAKQGMLVPGAPIGALAEEFRLVKRQLLNTQRAIRSSAGDRARMMLVCSANPNEGKTFCAINLALSLAAERETEVLLVDADFAKPDVLKRLGIADAPGLLDLLSTPTADVESHVIVTDIPQLSILPAGRKTNLDTELLGSERTLAVLQALLAANPRRIIVFDSPPALAASPAATLAHHVGQVMMVVRADKTSDADLRDAVGLLDGCEHIQLVLNATSFAPGGRRFGNYYEQESLT